MPEPLRKLVSTELKRCWRSQNNSTTEARNRFYLGEGKPATEAFESLSELVNKEAAPVGLAILERKLDKDGRYGISLGKKNDDGVNREKEYLLYGNIREYLDIDCSVMLNTSGGQMSIRASYLLLAPYWKVNYFLDTSYRAKMFQAVHENLILGCGLNCTIA